MREATSPKRWTVSIIYRCEAGPNVVDHEIEELGELAGIVERGPDWNSIMDITVQLSEQCESVVLQSPIQMPTPPEAT